MLPFLTMMIGGAVAVPMSYGIPPGAETFIRQELEIEQFRATSTDLNGDGSPEIVVMATTPRHCGSGGCTLYVLTGSGRRFTVTSRITISRAPVRVLDTSSHGWRDLGVRVAGGGDVRGHEAWLRFDGRSYPLNPSLAPAIRADVPGETVLE